MAYENFIETVTAAKIERDLERICVFAEDCNRNYEGIVKKRGDSVRILGVGKPTITDSVDKNITLSDAEDVEDTSVVMNINRIAYYNYKVGDIDKHEMTPDGLMETLRMETSEGLANKVDQFIAGLANDKLAKLDAAAAYQVTKDNVLEKIDTALTALYENDVAQNTKVTLTVSPKFYQILKTAYVALDTNNSNMLKNGKVGMYGNVTVKMSNNIYKSGGDEKIMLRTDRAVAFVHPMTHVEPYRPEKAFADAVKGFILYDGKIVRPKELIVMHVKY